MRRGGLEENGGKRDEPIGKEKVNAIQDNSAADTPHALYERVIDEKQKRRARLRRQDRAFIYAKLGVGLLAALLLLRYLYVRHGIVPLLGAAVVFAVLMVAHEIVLARMRAVAKSIAFHERGLARLEDRWAGTGESGERFVSDEHPYARDLDLFGSGSVFELLCIFRTRAGEEVLARWLLTAAAPEEIVARQQALRELSPRLALREKLFTVGEGVQPGLRPERLLRWAGSPFPLSRRMTALSAAVLGLLWIASLIYGIASGFWTALVFVSAVNIAVNHAFMKRLGSLVEVTEDAADGLHLLADVLRVLERESFDSVRMRGLKEALGADGVSAAAAIGRLDRTAHYLKQHHNPMVRFFDVFLFYTVLVTMRTEAWRKRFGVSIERWLRAAGEMEALAALATYAFEHPEDTWPEFTREGACFEAEGLAHPLLPAGKAVRNDMKLGGGMRMILVSGPNMSGKSTFIRGVGLNAVLAQCGAPVRARRLRMSPLAIGASICVLDSLQGGVSRFYAEIRRLKAIADLTQGAAPVLFLLDELLSGTNSHDRLEGTKLIVKTLLEQGAIGLVTTHDLALAGIPEIACGTAQNFHFEDRIEGGELKFDFRLQPGIVQTSNALKLLGAIGFRVEPAER